MMNKEDVLFEKAMDWVEEKYVEEALEPANTVKARKTIIPKKGWILTVAAVLVCLLTGGVILAETDIFQVNRDYEPAEEYYANSPESIGAYNQILRIVTGQRSTPPADGRYQYDVDGHYASDFASYYGGAYINVHGDLVVCLAESAGKKALQEGQEKLESICKTFKTVKYSYSDLINCMTDVYNYCQSEEYKTGSLKIIGFGIADPENAVSISVNTQDENVLDEIRSQVRIPDAVVFSYQE